MRADRSFLLQNIVSAEGEVKFAGAAVMDGKSKKLIGFLDEEELSGIIWMMGKARGGLIKSYDEQTKRLITYEVVSSNATISSKVSGGRVSFRVKIESEGRLIENDVPGGVPSRKAFLKRVDETFEKQLKMTLERALDKMQEQYGVDAAGFGDRVRIQHPRVWEKVKREWDETFRDSPVTFDVKLSVTDYGASSGLVKE
ncbi:hypothetical protein D3H35_10140 [Cohnella faecalis]|uniref:Spore germination GerAC-like C-terminal domain-containing protein n=3 Tax=Cohnella faecalis TaxID=2315694 RepID=A0A398CN36_9BACL|nr:hypothetical protein D3H35_10140 [Cohnella faecalis]